MTNLRKTLSYEPTELRFGTSGLRALVTDMTDLECYINALGFLNFVDESKDPAKDRPVYLAGDLRDSTPRISRAVAQAIQDAGRKVVYLGLIPTPAIANYALRHGGSAIMVTGSHIPADRNGIKFYKPGGEVLKEDEPTIKSAVMAVREALYGSEASKSPFDADGMLKTPPELPEELTDGAKEYLDRYINVFGSKALAGKKVVMYQHSAVGRDLIVKLLEEIGAEVAAVGRSEVFIPIDSENVTAKDEEYFHQIATDHPDAFAIISTDGDSDRPFMIDAKGEFHRGDMLGVVVAEWLKADAAAYPVSSSDAVDMYLTDHGVPWVHTRIGSPYVISAMKKEAAGGKQRVVGWEVNGGFLTGEDLEIHDKVLPALPTRDAVLPLFVAMFAAQDKGKIIEEVFQDLPQRYTQAGLINDFPPEVSKSLVKKYSHDDEMIRAELEGYFTQGDGFGTITSVNALDGVRIYFSNGDIAHVRPSGNAPQLRIYSVSGSQERADKIVELALAEPDGIFRRIQRELEILPGS
jgi:phosphomannomutase